MYYVICIAPKTYDLNWPPDRINFTLRNRKYFVPWSLALKDGNYQETTVLVDCYKECICLLLFWVSLIIQ